MRTPKVTAAALAVALLAAPCVPAFAQVSAGTTLVGAIDQSLNSKTAQIGQTFTLSNVNSPNHDINGATVYGHVASVQHAGHTDVMAAGGALVDRSATASER